MQDMQPCIEKHENHSIPGLLSSDDNSLLETKLFLQTIEELLCRSSIVMLLRVYFYDSSSQISKVFADANAIEKVYTF